MRRHMRTTVDLSDAVMIQAKRLARERGTTLRALLEEGLRLVLKRSEEQGRGGYRLPDRSYGEGGLVGGLDEDDWSRLRDLTYEGRGA